MDEGSPLKVYADRLQASVQQAYRDAGEEVIVLNGMAYSEPFCVGFDERVRASWVS